MLNRSGPFTLFCLMVLCAACHSDPRSRLSASKQATRDQAAATIRTALAADAAAAGDRSEAYWKKKLAAIPAGITQAEFQERTGGKPTGGEGSGQSSTMNFRLDDNWQVSVVFDYPDKLREVGRLSHSALHVWVEPPKDFSGRWVTYYVNGLVASDIEYQRGAYLRSKSYFDNGQLRSEQNYLDGQVDGIEIGFHRNGKKAYETQSAKGKSVGRWVFWYDSGRIASEATYVNGVLEGSTIQWRENGTKSSRIDYRAGQQIGQAAWNEHGELLYARGSLEHAPEVQARK